MVRQRRTEVGVVTQLGTQRLKQGRENGQDRHHRRHARGVRTERDVEDEPARVRVVDRELHLAPDPRVQRVQVVSAPQRTRTRSGLTQAQARRHTGSHTRTDSRTRERPS